MLKHTRNLITILCLLVCQVALADLSGDWQGKLNVNGSQLPLVIHLSQTEEQFIGTMDSPAQGVMDIPMTMVEYDDNKLVFEVANLGIHYEGILNSKNQTIEGTFIQGAPFELNLTRKQTVKTSNSDDLVDLFGQWGGTVEIPGNPLSLIIHINNENGVVQASADSPDQNATGLAVDSVTLKQGVMTFTMEALGVEYSGTLSEDKTVISGDFTQQGRTFKLVLNKGASPKQVYERPQLPTAPFDYHVEEVMIENQPADIQLAGTLTRPKDPKKVKAVAVMITGSGPQDRDETIMKHKPFWVIADHLTQQGYAVLRMDDRGVGESTGDFKTATSEDFVTDISAAVDYLKQQDDLPADKIGLIGHSEGGMIAPMLAAQRDDLAFLVLLAGPGVAITELLAEQKYLLAAVTDTDTESLKQQRVKDVAFHQNLVKWADDEQYTEAVKAQLEDDFKDLASNDKQLQSMVESNLKLYDTPWFKYFIAFEPAKYLQQVKTPLLALNGSKDLQVAADSNLAGIKAALSASGHPDFTTQKLDQLNHLFQVAQSGSPMEYGKLSETFSPVALAAITDWLDARFD